MARLLSTAQAARRLALSPERVRQLAATKHLAWAHKIRRGFAGWSYLFTPTEVERLRRVRARDARRAR